MMEADIGEILSNLVNTVGMWAVFAYLFIQERKAHDKTRRLWNDDLREIAGLTTLLQRSPPTLPHDTSPQNG